MFSLDETVEQKAKWVEQELSYVKNLDWRVDSLRKLLEELLDTINKIDVYAKDSETVETSCQASCRLFSTPTFFFYLLETDVDVLIDLKKYT